MILTSDMLALNTTDQHPICTLRLTNGTWSSARQEVLLPTKTASLHVCFLPPISLFKTQYSVARSSEHQILLRHHFGAAQFVLIILGTLLWSHASVFLQQSACWYCFLASRFVSLGFAPILVALLMLSPFLRWCQNPFLLSKAADRTYTHNAWY